MDLVTLTDSLLGLEKTPVRIVSITENETGELRVVAEDYPFGVASSVTYPDQPGLASTVDFNLDPGNILEPVFLEPPIEKAGPTMLAVWALATSSNPMWGGCDVWFSFDGDEYRMAGTINGGSIIGTTTSAISDSGLSVGIAMRGRGGQLLNVPVQDAENLGSLCWMAGIESTDGGEFFGYSTANLTGANAYTLGGLIRGAYQSNQLAKPSGTAWAKLDTAVVTTGPIQRSMIGLPVYFKFLSRNIYGGGQQSLEDVEPYIYTLRGNMAALPPADVQNFGIDGALLTWSEVAATDLAGYRLRFNYGSNVNWATATPIAEGLLTLTQHNLITRPSGVVTYLIKSVDVYGNESKQAATVVTNLGDALIANVVQSFPFSPSFDGTKTNCTVASGELVASGTDAFFSDPAQALFEADSAAMFAASTYSSMTYITGNVDINSALGGSIATLQIAYQGADLAVFYRKVSPGALFEGDADYLFPDDTSAMFAAASEWRPWPGQLQIENDIYQFKFEIGAGSVQGKITNLALVVDAPDILEYVNDVTISIGGTAVPYTSPFTQIQNVQVTLQAGTSGAVSVETDKTTPLAPVVMALDSAQDPVGGATADIILKGY
jgi:hypothetical protein